MKYGMLVLMLVPGVLAAQSQSPDATASSASRARIDAAVRAAAEAKIPTSLLTNKVAEGEAKHVDEARIATAVETRLRALLRASTVMKGAEVKEMSASDLAVAADALEAGVSESALIRVAKSAPEERRVVAVAVLADLVRLGKSSDVALTQVTAALGTSTALANLNAQVASQLRLGGLSSTLDATGIIRVP
jgi:hypothetical protein